jgi:hypothetical protein
MGVFTYISKDTSANIILTGIFNLNLKTKWFVNNTVYHNVRTHSIHHVCILRIGLKRVH